MNSIAFFIFFRHFELSTINVRLTAAKLLKYDFYIFEEDSHIS